LPRRFAPRNDGVFSFVSKLPTPSLRGAKRRGNPEKKVIYKADKIAKKTVLHKSCVKENLKFLKNLKYEAKGNNNSQYSRL
jgi:hypothetical protein